MLPFGLEFDQASIAYLTSVALNAGFVILPTTLVACLAYLWLGQRPEGERGLAVLVVMLMMALFGTVVGSATATSADGLAAVVPAVLTFVAGGLAYLFDARERTRLTLGVFMAFAFILSTFLAYTIFAYQHQKHVRILLVQEACLGYMLHPDILASDEVFDRARRVFELNCKDVGK